MSEIPCRLIDDVHEWRNELPTVPSQNLPNTLFGVKAEETLGLAYHGFLQPTQMEIVKSFLEMHRTNPQPNLEGVRPRHSSSIARNPASSLVVS